MLRIQSMSCMRWKGGCNLQKIFYIAPLNIGKRLKTS